MSLYPSDTLSRHVSKKRNIKLIDVQGPTEKVKNDKVDFIRIQLQFSSYYCVLHHLFRNFFSTALFAFNILLHQGVKFVHQLTGPFEILLFLLFWVYSHIANQFRKDRSDDWNRLRRVYIFSEVTVSCIFDRIPCQQLSLFGIFDLERVLLENFNQFSDRKLIVLFFKNHLEHFVLWDSFERNQVI